MPLARNYSVVNGQPGGKDAPQEYDVTYNATDNTNGASATAKYVMMVHDPYEQNYPDHMHRGIENVRPAPHATYIRSIQPDSTLTVYAEQSDSWSVSGSADAPLGAWVAATLGVNLQFSYSYSYNSGVQASVQHVPVGSATYLEEFDAYKYHTGKADVWGAGGYGGTAIYNFKEPDKPSGGYQAHFPPISLPNGTHP